MALLHGHHIIMYTHLYHCRVHKQRVDLQVQTVAKPRGINVNAVASKGTFRSSINLSQGAPATVRSTYGDIHGAAMPQLMAAVQTVAQQHAEVSVRPMWQLNPGEPANLHCSPLSLFLLLKRARVCQHANDGSFTDCHAPCLPQKLAVPRWSSSVWAPCCIHIV